MAGEDERTFPLLLTYRDERARAQALGCPRSIPWALIAPHEAQAKENHDQTLERLAERGGLDPDEAVAVLEDREWRPMDFEESIKALLALLEAHRGG